MRLSKQTTDAVKILTYCFRDPDELNKVGDIASATGLTKQMALKLANQLGQAGFVETLRGPSGGICLTEMALSATLGDVVRALENRPALKSEGRLRSKLEGVVGDAFEAFLEVLDTQSLADLSHAKTPKRRKKRPQRAAARAR